MGRGVGVSLKIHRSRQGRAKKRFVIPCAFTEVFLRHSGLSLGSVVSSSHPDPGSLVNVRTLGAGSLPIQEVFGAFFESYTTS